MAAQAPTESYIPPPTVSALPLGPLTTHFYALCILAGIAIALWAGSRRRQQRGGQSAHVLTSAFGRFRAESSAAGSTTSSPAPNCICSAAGTRGMHSPSATVLMSVAPAMERGYRVD